MQTEYDSKTISRHLSVPLNQKLTEIFDLIDYKTRFRMKLSYHAADRIIERITKKEDALQLGR